MIENISKSSGHSNAFNNAKDTNESDKKYCNENGNTRKNSDTEIYDRKISAVEVNRKFLGGKGAYLEMMTKLGMPVPKKHTIETKVLQEIENQPADIKILQNFFAKNIAEGDKELNNFFSSLQSDNNKTYNLTNILVEIKKFFQTKPETQKNYINVLSNFITSNDFYNIIKDSRAANEIRSSYRSIINDLPHGDSIIVRSSGTKEDQFGDAQAGKFESIIHKNKDILSTCLAVLATKYKPAVCQLTEPQPMALVLQHYINCVTGGVIMSATSRTSMDIKGEYGANHAEIISGKSGRKANVFTIHRDENSNSNQHINYEFTAGDTDSQAETSDFKLKNKTLKQLKDYIEKLEDAYNAPVDVEFGIDQQGELYIFQVRPITKLAGGMNFSAQAPHNPIITGTLVSEGVCSGKVVYIDNTKNKIDIPQDAIIVAEYCQDWMLEPDILTKAAGFIFKNGGTNDHIAITLRQANKPYLLADQQLDSIIVQNNQNITLACGNFNGTEGAYAVAGNELSDQLAKQQLTTANSFPEQPLSISEQIQSTINFDRPDTGFQFLQELNHELLNYFNSNSLITMCFADKTNKTLCIEKNREETIKNAKIEMNNMFGSLDLFIQSYERFLKFGVTKNSIEIEKKLSEAEQIKGKFQLLKTEIDNKLNNIAKKLTKDATPEAKSGSYKQYLQDCKAISTKTQKLNIPNNISQIDSLHDIIFWIHKEFIEALPTVAVNSRSGQVGILDHNPNKKRNSFLINFATEIEAIARAQRSIEAVKILASKYDTTLLTTNNATIVTAKLGTHYFSIEMLDSAEGSKGSLLRLKFSDDWCSPCGNHGKIKRFWFLAQLINVTMGKEVKGMNISVSEVTGVMTIEFPQIENREILESSFTKIIEATDCVKNLNADLDKLILNQSNKLWNFSLLGEKLKALDAKENQEEFFCIIFIINYFKNIFQAKYLHLCQNERIQHILKKSEEMRQKKLSINPNTIKTEFENIPELREKLLFYFLLNFPTKKLIDSVPGLLENKHLILEFVSESENFFDKIVDQWGDDKDVVLEAAKNGVDVSELVKKFEFMNDKETVEELVKNNRHLRLDQFDKKFSDDPDIVKVVVQRNYMQLQCASKRLQSDKAFVLDIVKQNGNALQYVSDELKNDKEIALAAVQQNGNALQYVNDELKNDKEITLVAVQESGLALEYVSDQLKNDKDIVLFAVNERGYALKYASCKLQNDREIVLAAAQQDYYALEYASCKLKNDKEIVLAAVHKNIEALKKASRELQNNRDFVLEVIKINHQAFDFVDKKLRDNIDFIIDALEANIRVALYIPEHLKYTDKRIATYLEKTKVESILAVNSCDGKSEDTENSTISEKPTLTQDNTTLTNKNDATAKIKQKTFKSILKKILVNFFNVVLFIPKIIFNFIVNLFNFLFKPKKDKHIQEQIDIYNKPVY